MVAGVQEKFSTLHSPKWWPVEREFSMEGGFASQSETTGPCIYEDEFESVGKTVCHRVHSLGMVYTCCTSCFQQANGVQKFNACFI